MDACKLTHRESWQVFHVGTCGFSDGDGESADVVGLIYDNERAAGGGELSEKLSESGFGLFNSCGLNGCATGVEDAGVVEVFSYVNAYDVVICHRFLLAMNGCWVVFVAGKNGSSGFTHDWHPHYKTDLTWLGWARFLLAVWSAPRSLVASPPPGSCDRQGRQ